MAELQSRRLAIPVHDVPTAALHDSYSDDRSVGAHEALDIAAPMRTPVLAVEDGVVTRTFTSRRGGLTVYQLDPTARYAYYYAHLDGYAPGLREGQHLKRCERLGYVGTTGNAMSNAPHLHFAIFKLDAERRWWRGSPLNPYAVMRGGPIQSAPCPASAD